MRTRKTVVILISGLAGTGKTTVSNILCKELEPLNEFSSTKYSFAQPIKYIAKAFFGWDDRKDAKGRRLLQQLGFIGREYKESIWVTHMFNRLDKMQMLPYNFVIVDDWRFVNEAAEIAKNPLMTVVTIRLIGRSSSIDELELMNDVSETSLPNAKDEFLTYQESSFYNFIINNDQDLESLEYKVKGMFEQIKQVYVIE